MSKGLMLCAAAVLALTAAEAQARTEHKSSRVYATYSHCTPSNHIDVSHLQGGELAIMIQDRGYRESQGSSFDAGECW
jgi:hypothetical protein